MHENDVAKLKASGSTASQILREYLNKGNTPIIEAEEIPVDLTRFLKTCERKRKNPQVVIDMIIEQMEVM